MKKLAGKDREEMQALLDAMLEDYEKDPDKVRSVFMANAFTFFIERTLFLGLVTHKEIEQSSYAVGLIRAIGNALDELKNDFYVKTDIDESLAYFSYVTSRFNLMDKAFMDAMPEPQTVFTVKSLLDFLEKHEPQNPENGIVSILMGEAVFRSLVKNTDLIKRFESVPVDNPDMQRYLLAGLIGQFVIGKDGRSQDKNYRIDVFSDINREPEFQVMNPNYIYILKNCRLNNFRVRHNNTFDSLRFDCEVTGAETFEFSEQNFLQ